MAANSLAGAQTKSTGGSTTRNTGPITGLSVTITLSTTK